MDLEFVKRSSILLAIHRKYSGYFYLLPENLDLEAHVEKFPLTDYRFVEDGNGKLISFNNYGTLGLFYDLERMKYLLGLVSSIPAGNKDSISQDGFVPINSSTIRNFFKDYLSYLDYLIDTGIVVSDNHYIPEIKSKSYKFAPQYAEARLVPHYYKKFNPTTVNAIEEEVFSKEIDKFERNRLLDLPYLAHWYNQKKLVINDKEALEYAKTITDLKLKNGIDSWDINRDSGKKKDPTVQYNAIIYNIEALKIQQYKAKIDNTVHRLHSVLTNMQKDYRNFLTYDGQQLVSIDITNSQPYLSCILFNPEFWAEDSSLTLGLNHLPKNVINSIRFTPPRKTAIPIPQALNKFFNELKGDEFDAYKNIVSSGEMYETIMKWVQEEIDESISRADAKTTVFKLFFTPNSSASIKDENHWLMTYYQSKFPQVADLFKIIKRNYKDLDEEKQHGRLACLLQAVESEIILHRCCRRIWEERDQQVPVFTIHDSIVTTLEHKEYVTTVMDMMLTDCIGVRPTLNSKDVWDTAKVYEKLSNKNDLK